MLKLTGKTPFFVIGPLILFALTLASDRAVLYILVLPTKTRNSSFLKNVFVFQKSKISTDCPQTEDYFENP